MVEIPKLRAGSKVLINVTEKGFSVERMDNTFEKFNFPLTEAALLKGMNAYVAHADEFAQPNAKELDV